MESKDLGVRPSELYGVTWPLAAFYLDRGLRNWANFVDRTVNDAEVKVRTQMRNNRRANVDMFAFQAKQVAFNKIMGISVESLYAAPTTGPKPKGEKRSAPKTKSEKDKLINSIPGMPRMVR